MKDTSKSIQYNIPITIYDLLTPTKFRKHATLIWVIIMSAIMGVDTILKIKANDTDRIIPVVFAGLIGILLPAVHGAGKNVHKRAVTPLSILINLSNEELSNWLKKQIQQALCGGLVMWITGLAIAILGVYTLFIFDLQNPNILFIALKVPLFFFCGTSAYSAVSGIAIPLRLKNLPLRNPIYYDNYSEIKKINYLILQYSLLGLFGFGLFLLALYLGADHQAKIIIPVWIGGTSILSLIFFPTTIWGLHNIMLQAKQETIKPITNQINENLQKTHQHNPDNLNQLNALLSLRNELEKIPEWPINFTTFVTLITPTISTTIAIINFIWPQ